MTALTRKESVRYISHSAFILLDKETSCGYLTALTRKESVRYIALTLASGFY